MLCLGLCNPYVGLCRVYVELMQGPLQGLCKVRLQSCRRIRNCKL